MNELQLFSSGIRPVIDAYLAEKTAERRNYGDYWSASSAGYCMRRNIFERLLIPHVSNDPRKQRVFEVGHLFHRFIQELTVAAGVSVSQEEELIDDGIMVKGHYDDLVLIDGKYILYDVKTQNSKAFTWQKKRGGGMSYFHRLQLGTYLYMINNRNEDTVAVEEARILKISKDDLRMSEEQVMWTDEYAKEVVDYWMQQNVAYTQFKLDGTLPPCTCHEHEGGFLAKEAYNPFFWGGQPCSEEWMRIHYKKKEGKDE